MIFCSESVLVLVMILILHLAMVTWLSFVLLALNQASTSLQIHQMILSELLFYLHFICLIIFVDGYTAETLLLMETSPSST